MASAKCEVPSVKYGKYGKCERWHPLGDIWSGAALANILAISLAISAAAIQSFHIARHTSHRRHTHLCSYASMLPFHLCLRRARISIDLEASRSTTPRRWAAALGRCSISILPLATIARGQCAFGLQRAAVCACVCSVDVSTLRTVQDVYVADSYNCQIRRIALTEVISDTSRPPDSFLDTTGKVLTHNLMLILLVVVGSLFGCCCSYIVCRTCFLCPLYRRKLHEQRVATMRWGERV
jgi:hypothetical protein